MTHAEEDLDRPGRRPDELDGALRKVATATRAAAPPPTPLNAATICGIAVILTRRAAGTATTAPIAIAPKMSRKWVSPLVANVTPIATAMPAAPMRLPRRAVLG